jgi:ASC-1-like (ASCH) protein
MNLQPKYYDYIKNGTKRIELRLYDEKRRQISIGDVIEFSKSNNNKFEAKVIGLLRYNSFQNLFCDFDISLLADSSMTKTELENVLNEFYSVEQQIEYGVVGIRIELLKIPCK